MKKNNKKGERTELHMFENVREREPDKSKGIVHERKRIRGNKTMNDKS